MSTLRAIATEPIKPPAEQWAIYEVREKPDLKAPYFKVELSQNCAPGHVKKRLAELTKKTSKNKLPVKLTLWQRRYLSLITNSNIQNINHKN